MIHSFHFFRLQPSPQGYKCLSVVGKLFLSKHVLFHENVFPYSNPIFVNSRVSHSPDTIRIVLPIVQQFNPISHSLPLESRISLLTIPLNHLHLHLYLFILVNIYLMMFIHPYHHSYLYLSTPNNLTYSLLASLYLPINQNCFE